VRLRTHALTDSLARAKLQHTIFLRPGLPVRFVVSVSHRALVNESHRKITHKKNAFQSLETHSETKFRKSVEKQKLLVSNFLHVRN